LKKVRSPVKLSRKVKRTVSVKVSGKQVVVILAHAEKLTKSRGRSGGVFCLSFFL